MDDLKPTEWDVVTVTFNRTGCVVPKFSGWTNRLCLKHGRVSQVAGKGTLVLASLPSGTTMPLIVFHQHTGYEIPTSAIEQPFIVSPEPQVENASISLDAEYVTDRIKDVFGLSISRLAQLLGVSRTAVYNWRNGEKLTEKNLARLADFNDTADLFETENIEVALCCRGSVPPPLGPLRFRCTTTAASK